MQRIDHDIRTNDRQTESQSTLAEPAKRRHFTLPGQSRRRSPTRELTNVFLVHVELDISQRGRAATKEVRVVCPRKDAEITKVKSKKFYFFVSLMRFA